MIIGCVWRVVWGDPYTDPPSGNDRMLVEVFEPVGSHYWSKRPPEIEAAYPGVGHGYVISWTYVSDPIRQLSREALASVRRKRLERRVRQKYPLLAEQIISEELAKKPDYYNGITDPSIQKARDEIIRLESERDYGK